MDEAAAAAAAANCMEDAAAIHESNPANWWDITDDGESGMNWAMLAGVDTSPANGLGAAANDGPIGEDWPEGNMLGLDA